MGLEETLSIRLNREIGRETWSKIDRLIKAEITEVPNMIKNMQAITEQMDNILVTPLADQITYRNLTYFMNIVVAINKVTSFPWQSFFDRHTVMGFQYQKVIRTAPLVADNPFIELELTGFFFILEPSFLRTAMLCRGHFVTVTTYPGHRNNLAH